MLVEADQELGRNCARQTLRCHCLSNHPNWREISTTQLQSCARLVASSIAALPTVNLVRQIQTPVRFPC
jgi:hypothetical protein